MAEFDLKKMNDQDAAIRLLELLDREDPFILLNRDGPAVLALSRRFDLIEQMKVPSPLDGLEPELACKLLLAFEKWRLSVTQLDSAKNHFGGIEATYKSDSSIFSRPLPREHRQQPSIISPTGG
jgi:hypothetical protein